MFSYLSKEVELQSAQVWNNVERLWGIFRGLTGTQTYIHTQYVLYNQFPGMRQQLGNSPPMQRFHFHTKDQILPFPHPSVTSHFGRMWKHAANKLLTFNLLLQNNGRLNLISSQLVSLDSRSKLNLFCPSQCIEFVRGHPHPLTQSPIYMYRFHIHCDCECQK